MGKRSGAQMGGLGGWKVPC